MSNWVSISIIIPVLDDAQPLQRLLADLGQHAAALQVLVVDGGSTDDSVAVARQAGAQVVRAARSRGRQINAGIRHATGTWVWVLHSDTRVPLAVLTFLRTLKNPGWGRFDVDFEPGSSGLRLVAAMMNQRSRLTGICTGDQGMFVHRRLLERVGGMPEQALMEDIELSRRLRALGPPICASVRLVTSSRRWRRDGVLATVLAMWGLRLRYWLGADPEVLAAEYYASPTEVQAAGSNRRDGD